MASSRTRQSMQSWELFPLYLSEGLWEKIQDTRVSSVSVLEALTKHLVALGLRAPSENTQAMVLSLLNLREPEERRRTDSASLRTAYLNVKGHLQSMLQRSKAAASAPPNGVSLISLPADPMDTSVAFREVAFGRDEIVPPALSIDTLQEICRTVPLRSTNASAKTSVMPPETANPLGVSAQFALGVQIASQFLMGNMQGVMPGQQVPISILPPRPRPLDNLLQRADREAQEEAVAGARQPEQRGALALQDAPRPLPPSDSPPDVAASASSGNQGSAALPAPSEQREENREEPTPPNQVLGPLSRQDSLKGEQPVKVSLQESLARLHEARQPASTEKPAKGMKRPVSKQAVSKSIKKKPAAADSLAPKAKPKSKKKAAPKSLGKGKTKAVKDASTGKTKAEKLQEKLKVLDNMGVSKKLRSTWAKGCARCRNAPYCTLSCWKNRGFTP